MPKKRDRVQQKEDAREEQRKEARVRVDESMEGWKNTTNEEREECQLLRVGPEELLMVTNIERAAADKAVSQHTEAQSAGHGRQGPPQT